MSCLDDLGFECLCDTEDLLKNLKVVSILPSEDKVIITFNDGRYLEADSNVVKGDLVQNKNIVTKLENLENNLNSVNTEVTKINTVLNNLETVQDFKGNPSFKVFPITKE